MKVLSLFDGISCGMAALERAGITVERYAVTFKSIFQICTAVICSKTISFSLPSHTASNNIFQ